MVNGLTGKSLPLLNPHQGLRGGDSARRLPYYGDKEFLQHAEVPKSIDSTSSIATFLFGSSLPSPAGVDENICCRRKP